MMSLLLTLAMSFALAVPAFAAGPGDGDEGIMPLMQLYPNDEINIRSGSTVALSPLRRARETMSGFGSAIMAPSPWMSYS